ncbi:MAG: ImmA/IrrE family metallo-endopeptidase [Sorangiineae bacterium PRO1]|nr:ImmA/IrrE family metallo-endopeptidase [Sorangiineae bacterium PRO1]
MIGERLRFAREKRGLTLNQVADLSAIGSSSLSDFENDKRQPKLAQLQALAKLYGRSEAFFFQEGTLPAEQVLWRQRPVGDVASAIESQFVQLCEQYHNLELWCAERVAADLPVSTTPAESFTYSTAEELAHRVRKALNLGDCPARALRSVLEESCGVKIFHLSVEPTGTAACSRSDAYGMAVLLNTNNRRWRRNFDLAHELFHLLTWQAFRGQSDATAPPLEEKLADAFASALVLPTDAVQAAVEEKRQAAGKLNRSALFDIAREFDVSVEALLWKLKKVYNRTEEATRADIEACKQLAKTYETRKEEQPPPIRPERFNALVLKALQRGELSTGRAAEYLGISRREAMKLEELDGAQDAEVAISPA